VGGDARGQRDRQLPSGGTRQAKIFDAQGIEASIVLTSSANAVVAKRGSEAYDVSKAAVSTWLRSRGPGCLL